MVGFTTNCKLSTQNVSISKHDLSLIGRMAFVYQYLIRLCTGTTLGYDAILLGSQNGALLGMVLTERAT